MTYTEDEIKSFKVWGEFHNYPKCCIDWFCSVHYTERPDDYNSGAAYGTGYLPCPECSCKCNTEDDLYNILGRDIKLNQSTKPSEVYEETLEDMLSNKYKSIASKHNLDYTDYLEWVNTKCNEFKLEGVN